MLAYPQDEHHAQAQQQPVSNRRLKVVLTVLFAVLIAWPVVGALSIVMDEAPYCYRAPFACIQGACELLNSAWQWLKEFMLT